MTSLRLEKPASLRKAMTRRRALAVLAAGALARCGSNPDLDLATLRQLIRRSPEMNAVTRDQAAQIPFASIGIRVDGGPQAMLVLATDTAGDLLWTSAARVALVTRAGRIIQTAGFHDNLTATRFEDNDPVAQALDGPATRSLRFIDLPDGGGYSIQVESMYRSQDVATITILGTALRTRPVVETNRCPKLNWTFQNIFWRDVNDGFVWRSSQTISPKGPVLEIEVLRPPASNA